MTASSSSLHKKGGPLLDEETLRIWTHFCCPHVFLSLCKALKSLLTFKVEREMSKQLFPFYTIVIPNRYGVSQTQVKQQSSGDVGT